MIPFGKDKRVAKRQKMLEDQLEQIKKESQVGYKAMLSEDKKAIERRNKKKMRPKIDRSKFYKAQEKL